MSNESDIKELRRRVEALESEKQGWNEYRELVLSELNRVQTWLEQLSVKTNTYDAALIEKLATLKADLTATITNKADEAELSALEQKTNENAKEIAKLTVKAGVWGALAGAIPAVVAVVWWLLG